MGPVDLQLVASKILFLILLIILILLKYCVCFQNNTRFILLFTMHTCRACHVYKTLYCRILNLTKC